MSYSVIYQHNESPKARCTEIFWRADGTPAHALVLNIGKIETYVDEAELVSLRASIDSALEQHYAMVARTPIQAEMPA